ncbi:MAG: 5-formyltetrahydrofolate cyclo-ligase [Sphingomonas sp.]|uniref:5-formyltetrahydrofolate cyclo-ligase n=1 Tax=Sphingomonas sp. TaxID=28214 RepID=UPI001ACE0216|nr:5-formyltetrahydrofolate cyclo-ligase [Sphingomonas sp.]MBN8807176.1 5-formyltetrahydrofolate cyclo-ligase [Sphingomonas sp.]
MTSPRTATAKSLLRAQIRAARDVFVAIEAPTIPVPDALRERLSHGVTIASYVPLGSEADPSPLARAAVAAGCAVALPHVVSRAEPMRFLAWDAEDDLVPGAFGLHQPHHAAPALAPDIILTPLVAFDASLNRLGQGAGHYDRAFALFPDAWRLGVAWSVQEVDALPVDAWDVPLHAIVTEQGLMLR